MLRRLAACGLVAASAALAGCATTAQPAQTTTPAQTSAPPASTTPASTTPPAPAPQPVDTAALKREAFKTCSQSPPDELQSRYNSPSSDPVQIADAYARTFPPPERVPVAEGCYNAINQQLGNGP